MKKQVLLFYLLCQILFSYAQNAEIITIKPGDDAKEKLIKQVYVFPTFVKGDILFDNGKLASGSFNYNTYFDKMDFINGKGDTLALNTNPFRYISLGKDTFYFDNNSYYQLIGRINNVQFFAKQSIKEIERKKSGGYGESFTTSSVDSYNSLTTGSARYNLNVNEVITMRKETAYYISSSDVAHIDKLTKRTLLKAFNKQQKMVEQYVNDNKIDLNNRENVEKLIAFLKTL